jgi:hypothetical protein
MEKSLKFNALSWNICTDVVFDLQCKIAVAYDKGDLMEVTRLCHDRVTYSKDTKSLALFKELEIIKEF